MLDATASMIQYRGTGGESVFPIPFPFQETAHIHAHVSEGMTTRGLSPGADFSVAGGELVLLRENLPAGQLLTIRRLLPLTQEILFHNQGPNSPKAVEEAVDKLTMISQQLQAAVETCLQAPDAETAADLAGAAAANAARVAAVEQSLAAKADRTHAHAQGEIPGLVAGLAAKADAVATTQALAGKAALAQLAAKADLAALAAKADRSELAAKADASLLALKADKTALDGKADRTELAGKANSVHSHGIDAVAGLSAALAAKLNADDPRLDLIGSGGGGTTDHAQLENRDAAGQHPQGAITNLTADLSALRAGLSGLEESGAELFDHIDTLAGRTDELSARADVLGGRLGGVESGAAALAGRLDDAETGAAAFAGRLDSVESGIAAEGGRISALTGRMTAAEDAASEIRADAAAVRSDVTGVQTDMAAMRTDVTEVRTDVTAAEESLSSLAAELERLAGRLGALEQNPGGNSGGGAPAQGGGGIVGDIRLLPFRADALPSGWHFCGGAALPLSSPAGQALASLPESFKTDWGVLPDSGAGTITLPNLFDAETGAGLFLRGVDGTARLPGSAQGDVIRNITGTYGLNSHAGPVRVAPLDGNPSNLSGAFTTETSLSKQLSADLVSIGVYRVGDLMFDASLSVPTGEENRPVNIGMTPAIYLGA